MQRFREQHAHRGERRARRSGQAPERPHGGRRHQGQRAARRRGRQLQADARGDRHRQRRHRRVLVLVKTIVSFPPTSATATTAVWGPHSEPLDKNAWRLTVTRVEPHVFSWALDGKPRPPTTARSSRSCPGTHTRAVDATAARLRTTAAARSWSTGTRRRRCPITTTRSASRRSRIRARRAGRRHDDRRRLQRHQGRSARDRALQCDLPLHRDAGRGRRAQVRAPS